MCSHEKYTKWSRGKKCFKWLKANWIQIKVFVKFNSHKQFICVPWKEIFVDTVESYFYREWITNMHRDIRNTRKNFALHCVTVEKFRNRLGLPVAILSLLWRDVNTKNKVHFQKVVWNRTLWKFRYLCQFDLLYQFIFLRALSKLKPSHSLESLGSFSSAFLYAFQHCFLDLVTSCLVMTVQSCAEWISIKKRVLKF